MFELPKRTHLVHKPVEPRNLSKKLQAALDLHTEEYLWQLKFDGCHMIVVVKDGKASAYSREGNPVLSVPHVLFAIEQMAPANYVYFGEAYSFAHSHSKISGMFRTQSPQPLLAYVLFDGVPLADFVAGHCPIRYRTRMNEVDLQVTEAFGGAGGPLFVPHTVTGEELSDLDLHLSELRKYGNPVALDGYVAKRVCGEWLAGAGKGGEQIKVKNHVSLDLLCVAVKEGKGKFAGMVGSLLCEYNGQLIEVGGGTLTDVQRRACWDHDDPTRDGLRGAIVEIHALAASEHGVLREPRFHRVRPDKQEPSV